MIYRPTPSPAEPSSACWLPVEHIIPRASLHYAQEEGSLRALMSNIRQEGLHRPVLVRQTENGRYIIVSGNRRLLACRKLGMSHIEAVVLPALPTPATTLPETPRKDAHADDAQLLLDALSRHTYHYFDEAVMMQRLNTRCGMSREAIARALYTTAQAVTDRLQLLSLSEPLRAFLMEEGAPERIAFALLRLPDASRRMAVARRAARERLCVREVEALVTSALTRRAPASNVQPAPIQRIRCPRARRTQQAKPPPKPTRRVVTRMRDTLPYINAIRNITDQMCTAGLEATLTEQEAEGQHEMILRFRQRRPGTA